MMSSCDQLISLGDILFSDEKQIRSGSGGEGKLGRTGRRIGKGNSGWDVFYQRRIKR